jgi:hypothetical protein
MSVEEVRTGRYAELAAAGGPELAAVVHACLARREQRPTIRRALSPGRAPPRDSSRSRSTRSDKESDTLSGPSALIHRTLQYLNAKRSSFSPTLRGEKVVHDFPRPPPPPRLHLALLF